MRNNNLHVLFKQQATICDEQNQKFWSLTLILTASKQYPNSLLRAEKSHNYPTPCPFFMFKKIFC
jgi:hypothetical protein